MVQELISVIQDDSKVESILSELLGTDKDETLGLISRAKKGMVQDHLGFLS